MMAANMPFFGYMSIAFMTLGAVWLVLYCYNWRDVIPLQHCITALIFLGMMEMSTWCGCPYPLPYIPFNVMLNVGAVWPWKSPYMPIPFPPFLPRYFDFVNFNVTGLRPIMTTLWAVAFGSLRKTVARMLVLVVSMGYGVVKPTLGGLTNKARIHLHLLFVCLCVCECVCVCACVCVYVCVCVFVSE
jgi:hypothetical protein